MKKFVSILLVFALALATLTACSQGSEKKEKETAVVKSDPVDVRVMALKGPTAMGMVKFMSDVDAGTIDENNYEFTIVGAIDEVTPKIVQGEVDIAAVPANLASVLYNNTEGGVEVLAINTLGVLYIVENGSSISSVVDLKGKTIFASGKGATPEYALNYILENSGLVVGTDVQIEWKSEHTECLTALVSTPNSVALLPEPFVTTAKSKSENVKVAIDLTEAWEAVQKKSGEDSALITGVVVARKGFIEEHPEAVEDFLKNYNASVKYVNNNTDDAAKLIGDYDIIAEEVAKMALPTCNITFIAGSDMKEKLSGYLKVLYDANPKSVGGKMPEDDFYYKG